MHLLFQKICIHVDNNTWLYSYNFMYRRKEKLKSWNYDEGSICYQMHLEIRWSLYRSALFHIHLGSRYQLDENNSFLCNYFRRLGGQEMNKRSLTTKCIFPCWAILSAQHYSILIFSSIIYFYKVISCKIVFFSF